MLPREGTHIRSEVISREKGKGEWPAVDLRAENSSHNQAHVVSLNNPSADAALPTPGGAKVMSDSSMDHATVPDSVCSRLEPVPHIRLTLQTHLDASGLEKQGASIEGASNAVFPRTVSVASTDSHAEYCRICQQPTDEPLIELGCQCRGELSKTHRSCIQKWFNNKGSNKCEVCGHVAANVPAPASQPLHNFWAWRMSRSHGRLAFQRWQRRGHFHPLLAALLILVAGLLFDILISYYLGASALPVNIIIGVLVVLGLGTGGRLIIECYRERNIRRRIRQLEIPADVEHGQTENDILQ